MLTEVARTRTTPTVIARHGDLVVERDAGRPTGRMLRQADMEASYVDLADPRHLEFDYLRWMRVVLRACRARRVVHIGGAGCALARALAVEDPEGLQLVCEVDGDVLDLARAHMGLRRARGLRVRHIDGRAFVAGQPDASWDAVVIDAFVGALVPRALITAQALAEVARIAPLALVNVIDDRAARQVHAVAAGLATAYARVWTIGGRVGNAVVAGAAARPDTDLIAARLAGDPSPPPPGGSLPLAHAIAVTPPLRDEELEEAPRYR
jgi:hypothetical protein